MQLEKALHAQRGQRQEKRDAGYQEEAETDYRAEMDEEEVAHAEAEDEEQAERAEESADEWAETLAAYDAWCDWLEEQEALANAAAEDDPDLENARRTYEETEQQREAFSNEQTQAEIEQQDIAALDADAETRLKAALTAAPASYATPTASAPSTRHRRNNSSRNWVRPTRKKTCRPSNASLPNCNAASSPPPATP